MKPQIWSKVCQSEPDEEQLWELFHVNSRSTPVDRHISNANVSARMLELANSLDYEDRPTFKLPESQAPLDMRISEVFEKRRSSRGLSPVTVSMESLAALLRAGYGETRENKDGVFPRPFRTVPSAGALYPLELYFHTVHTVGLEAGLYHYSPSRDVVTRIRDGDGSRFISEGLVQRTLAFDCSIFFFISGLPERSTFKYGNRGYRFLLMEAGHMAQNLSLTATALSFGCICVGGFFDRPIDEYLGFDGLNQSVFYLLAIGEDAGEAIPSQTPLAL